MERMPRHVYGVDFSGARDAGKKIWIATGLIEGEALCVEDCCPALNLPDSGVPRDQCLAALRHFIAARGSCVVGLDFPFGLPRDLVSDSTWVKFLSMFKSRCRNPEHFRKSCLRSRDGKELKRTTDRESRTPFSAYNLRLYRQTYFGIGDLLASLVQEHCACVLPMQHAVPGVPWLIEICPASTLRRHGLNRPPYVPYKGKTPEHRTARRMILKKLEEAHGLAVASRDRRLRILENPTGDALDAVIAAVSTFRALRDGFHASASDNDDHLVEGYVYA